MSTNQPRDPNTGRFMSTGGATSRADRDWRTVGAKGKKSRGRRAASKAKAAGGRIARRADKSADGLAKKALRKAVRKVAKKVDEEPII